MWFSSFLLKAFVNLVSRLGLRLGYLGLRLGYSWNRASYHKSCSARRGAILVKIQSMLLSNSRRPILMRFRLGLGPHSAACALLSNSGKTERSAKRFLACFVARTAPFALLCAVLALPALAKLFPPPRSRIQPGLAACNRIGPWRRTERRCSVGSSHRKAAPLRCDTRSGMAPLGRRPRPSPRNRHFFHHPAEMPEVIALPGGHWFAHWVESPGGDSDAEYVYVSSSTDGAHWTMPLQAHHDHSAVQHGLASMIANPDGGGSIFWLEALKGEDAPVALKRTIVDATGKEVREEVIDSDVCGCCPTAVAKTSKGLLLAFRAHSQRRHSRHRGHAPRERQVVYAQDCERGRLGNQRLSDQCRGRGRQGRSRSGGLVYRRAGYAPRIDGVFERQRFQL